MIGKKHPLALKTGEAFRWVEGKFGVRIKAVKWLIPG